ncbi:MAG: rod shape-determining protein MreC [Alistipes sp.]
MHKLLEFIRSIYVVVLFILLEIIALSYYAHSTTYTQARLLTRSNQVIGGTYSVLERMRHFCYLGRENDQLTAQVIRLEKELLRYRSAEIQERLDSYLTGVDSSQFQFSTAKVVSNQINKSRNYIVLNRGKADGVADSMAVLSSDGAMAGYVLYASQHYAVAVSILNTEFRASGKLTAEADADYSGSIFWTGSDRHYVEMREISKYANIHKGDEIVSTGFSSFFPADVLIGTVESFTLDQTKTAYDVVVRLAADMTALGDVILVRNRDLKEIQRLENQIKNRYQ